MQRTAFDAKLADIRVSLALLRVLVLLRKAGFNPDQPRVPAGQPGGGQWTDGGGGDETIAANRTRVAQAGQPSDRGVDLLEEEQRGGHTISEHVGKTDEYMLRRMQRERIETPFATIARKRVGSFTSLQAATRLVNSTLAQNQDIVDLVASGQKAGAFVTAQFDSPTGREVYATSERAQPYMLTTYGVGVRIVHDPTLPRGYRVVSAYPRND